MQNAFLKSNIRLSSFFIIMLCFSACRHPDAGSTQPEHSEVQKNLAHGSKEQDKSTIQTVKSLKEQAAWSKTDLAQRLEVSEEVVAIIKFNRVYWSSAALGCPDPDKQYIQANIPGVMLLLQVGDIDYRYHARKGTTPFYCPEEQAEPPVPERTEEMM